MKSIAFKDRVKVQVYAGNGGDGCVSFRREKFVPYGGPDGGNGGHGGHIILKACKDVDSLVNWYYQPIQRAKNGLRGSGNNRTGETGDDLTMLVPCGTVVYQIPEHAPHNPLVFEVEEDTTKDKNEVAEEKQTLLGEVVNDGDTLQVVTGGKGGRGNATFSSSTNRAPRDFTPGTEGEHRRLLLELKLVAEVGLVGYPNAGKSTLLSKLSHAHPKIAPYPFTTLNPLIGILTFEDYTTIRIADIPGLIDGAHNGVGLGHDFLRHVERTKLLLFIIDMGGVDARDPVQDYQNLRQELALYNEDLPHRPALVIANKMDLPESPDNLKRFIKETGITPLIMSAEQGEGIENLKETLYDWKRGRRFIDPAPDVRT